MEVMVLAHAGAGSLPDHTDATEDACRKAINALHDGLSPLDAAVLGCTVLEDDPRTNAGTGSNIRADGKTIELDASCMTSDGQFGAVAGLQRVKNPVLVARHVHASPYNVLAGQGAIDFARRLGHDEYDPMTDLAKERHEELVAGLRGSALDEFTAPRLSPDGTRRIVNGHDTVGVVVRQGDTFAAASSTGGLDNTLLGRVGDVPLFGCGIFAGPSGAVAVTGDGEALTKKLLGYKVYQMLEDGVSPSEAAGAGIDLFSDSTDVGIVLIGQSGGAGASNRRMAWSLRETHA